jgi:hypothetical protein
LRRTPGRLALILAGLVTLGLATGVAAGVGVRQRADLVDGVTARSGRLAVAAQQLYRALSDADATAASAFLSNGIDPPSLRARYQADIAQAAAALAEVSGAGHGGATVAQIAAQLPVYTGLVETARSYNRQGLPLGAAYLREASGLMRDKLLPAAQELYRAVSRELDAARGDAAAFPWFAVALGVLTLAALGLAQVWLTRRTNRVFNVGLVGATAAALLLLIWLGIATVIAGNRLEASRESGSAQVNRLAEARIAALQARTDESLTLVARGNGAAFEQDYVAVMRRLAGTDGGGGLLAEAGSAATDATTREAAAAAAGHARAWLAAHQKVRAQDDGGDYAAAVNGAIGAGPGTTAALSQRLDGELDRAIAYNSQRFDREARGAGRALSGADIGLAVLAALVGVGAALGIQRRIAEYR